MYSLAGSCSILMTFYRQVRIFAVITLEGGDRGGIATINVFANL
jgi:hypothetical protein